MKSLESIRGGLRLFRVLSPQIRASQIDMLLTIALNPGISQTELATECDLTLSGISRGKRGMTTQGRSDGKGGALGLIVETRVDGRTIVLELSDKGKKLIALYQEMSS